MVTRAAPPVLQATLARRAASVGRSATGTSSSSGADSSTGNTSSTGSGRPAPPARQHGTEHKPLAAGCSRLFGMAETHGEKPLRFRWNNPTRSGRAGNSRLNPPRLRNAAAGVTGVNDIVLDRPGAASPPPEEPVAAVDPSRAHLAPSWAAIGIFLLLLLAALTYAREFLMPVALGFLSRSCSARCGGFLTVIACRPGYRPR